jgi:two-component system sensor histidine kinase/response regulator
MGGLLIHLSGGRIETHFHIFGSLAFLAFYRDAWVLGTATAVVIADHLLRGLFIPQSIYGVAAAGGWRVVEHAFWVVFEDVFLLLACAQSRLQLNGMAAQQAQLEQLNGTIEQAVRVRTRELSLKTEELAAARDAAMESARLKSQFLANVSHEIRTPMNGVLGMTSILLDSELTLDQRDCALTVQRSAEGLLTVINDILDFSKIEAGKLALERVDFQLVNQIEDTLALVAEAATTKRLELICDLDPEMPFSISGDPGRLRQILVNLVANAIKFTDAGEVSLRVREIRREAGSSRLRFEVRDSGIGIPEEAGSKLFQAFTQVDGTTTRLYEGTGLGLAISKQLVELMRGQIGFHSTLGKGSTFWFEIEAEVVADSDAGDLQRRQTLRGLRALVVDDHRSTREVLAQTLESWGMSAVQATGGSDALKLLDDAAVDIVLIDLQMPEMDGVQLAGAIQRRTSSAATPLLMLIPSGHRSAQPAEVGVAAFVTKPVRRHLLLQAVARACGRPVTVRDSSGEEMPHLDRSLAVLVAEDNPVNQRVILRMLERLGQSCELVGDGEEAIEAVRSGRYDVVLMDCQMPRVDGFAATAAIRNLPGSPGQIPIIAVTANAMSGARERCLAVGMTGHLAKPIRLAELAEVLRSVQSELTAVS